MDRIRNARSCCASSYSRAVHNYSSFISSSPRKALAMSVAFMIFMSAISFLVRPEALPDLSSPEKGMEPRGTAISGASNALFTKLRNAGYADIPADAPALFKTRRLFGFAPINGENSNDAGITHSRFGSFGYDSPRSPRSPMSFGEGEKTDLNADTFLPVQQKIPKELAVGLELGLKNEENRELMTCAEGLETSFFFEMIFEANGGSGALTLDTLQALCNFEDEFNAFAFESPPPCEFRAVHNHVASFFGIGTCRNITQEHVQNFTDVLVDCHPFYESGQLTQCFAVGCGPGVPEECSRDDIVFDSLHSLIDKEFSPARPTVALTKLIRVRDLTSEEIEALHFEFLPDKVGASFGGAKLSGYGDTFGEYKFDVFSTQLLLDIAFALLALGLIYAIMYFHTQSLFITTFAFMQIILALTVSFGIYNIVLWLPFFPYLNLVSAFLVMGIGVDDVFVLYDAWLQSAVQTGTAEFAPRMAYCLESAGGSLITTSLTTSSAFFSIAFSTPITALRCFGIFCGLVIMVDFLLMMTFFPALIIVYERYVKNTQRCCQCYIKCTSQEGKVTELGRTEKFFRDTFGPFVLRFRLPLIVLCLAVAGGIGSQLFNIKRSTSATLQFYVDSNPFEAYDLRLRNKFNVFVSPTATGGNLDAHFVFGVSAKDNGNFFDPDDKGFLEHVALDVFPAQEWLADFCDNVRQQSFYVPTANPFQELCFFEFFRGWVNASCAETSPFPLNSGGNFSDYFTVPARSQCCNSTYPMEDAVEFDQCLRACASVVDGLGLPTGLGFDVNTLVSVQYRFLTNQPFTEEFGPMDALFNSITVFQQSQLVTAPAGTGVDQFFFASSFQNLDLQRFLFEGAIQSFAVSMIIALVVVVLMTQSISLSVLSILTLVAIVALIYGVIVLLGWELNIFESVIFSVAVGLSVDFTVHYSHSYLHAGLTTRRENVLKMYEIMAVSLLYGATSTFASGFALTFAQTLFFYKFGIFLMLTMSISLLYANLLLPPLLSLLGPVKAKHDVEDKEKEVEDTEMKPVIGL